VGVYDQAGRYTIKRHPEAFFTWRAPSLSAAWKWLRWQDTRTLAFPGLPDRVCDTVAEFELSTDSRRRCLVDVEVQAEPDEDMLERVGEYALRLRRERRYEQGPAGKYVVLGIVLNLTGDKQPRRLDMSVPEWSDAGHWLQVSQATLSTESAGSTLARIAAGDLDRWVLPWVPVLQDAAEAANMAEWKRLAAQEADSRNRSDFAALAAEFAELAGTAALWRKALKGWNMRESPQVLEWQREARTEARTEARLETRREYVERAVRLRFGRPVPADLADQLAGIKSAAELDRWFDASQTAHSLDAFRAAVENGKRKRKRSP
jgi:hypothetical protein